MSYDPTRELYKEFNAAFAENGRRHRRNRDDPDIAWRFRKQARSVIDGLEADVVTLALEADIDAIGQRKAAKFRRLEVPLR